MALQSWAWFLREGKALDAGGVVSSAAVPGVDEDWKSIGKISTWNRKLEKTAEDIMSVSEAAPGQLSRGARITTGSKEDYEFTALEVTALAIGLAFGAQDELTSATETFVPNKTYTANGWLKLQKYTDKNESFFRRDLWCQLDCEISEGGIIKPKFTAYVIPVALDLITGAA